MPTDYHKDVLQPDDVTNLTPVQEFQPAEDMPEEMPLPPGRLRLPSTDEPAAAEGVDAAAARAIEVRKLQSDNQLLVRWHEGVGAWMRLASGEPLTMGDQFMVLPTYRPVLIMSDGLELTLCGATRGAILEESSESGNEPSKPSIGIEYGCVIIATGGKEGGQISLRCGPCRQAITLLDASSAAAIEVRRIRAPGQDPEQTDAHCVVRLWATGGPIQLQRPGQAPAQIDPGMVFVCVDEDEGSIEPAHQSPLWLESLPLRPIDREASRQLDSKVTAERPVARSLDDATHDRRAEVRALAVGCLAHFEQYGALVRALGSEEQRSWWTLHFDSLQEALARSRQSAQAVHQALQDHCGGDASLLYRLAWGYSDEQLRVGADAELVHLLGHESLSVRVFGLETLRRITGKTLSFLPWVPQRQRHRAVVAWQNLQEDGGVRHRQPALALPGRE
jgi:hypothetical protein